MHFLTPGSFTQQSRGHLGFQTSPRQIISSLWAPVKGWTRMTLNLDPSKFLEDPTSLGHCSGALFIHIYEDSCDH